MLTRWRAAPSASIMTMINDRLRLGAVGCGWVFVYYHLPSLRKSPDWTLVSVCDVSKEFLDWFQRFFAGTKCFRSFPDLLRSSTLDAVLITTPPATDFPLRTLYRKTKRYPLDRPSACQPVLVGVRTVTGRQTSLLLPSPSPPS